MKYRDLIQFEPINEVVQFDLIKNGNEEEKANYKRSLVSNFVFSETYEKVIIPEICRNLDYTVGYETFGLQIVGNYGTGKSHLMSLFSLVAEDSELLPLVKSESARQVLSNIAGRYMIIRFELGSTEELWNIVCEQIDDTIATWGMNYFIAADNKGMYRDRLNRLMAAFEEAFPGKGLMIVIDEMLSYLKGRATDDRLNRDLAVLQALGQMSNHSKFRMVFGVQELIYNTAQFSFAADMLGRVNDRFRQITITKQDVQFVVQQRMLHKTDAQRQTIQQHLSKFTEFFTDMHAKLDEYTNLYPVHPAFFENFIEEDSGKWRLPNIQDDKDVVALRTKALLREFKIYVETANKPKGKIKEARVEALRTGFKQCYIDKDFQTIVTVGDKIPQNLLTEDEVLLQFYDIAQNKL